MLGTFSEQALSDYAEKVRAKQVKAAVQGTEVHDTNGVGPNDKTFLETDESQERENYTDHSEWGEYDFTVCVRDNGTVYGTRGKCRLGV